MFQLVRSKWGGGLVLESTIAYVGHTLHLTTEIGVTRGVDHVDLGAFVPEKVTA
jgi:hypothetical protein